MICSFVLNSFFLCSFAKILTTANIRKVLSQLFIFAKPLHFSNGFSRMKTVSWRGSGFKHVPQWGRFDLCKAFFFFFYELNQCPFDCLLFGKSDTFLLDIESEERTQMHAGVSLYLIDTPRSCIRFERPPGKSISNQTGLILGTCLNLNLSAVCCFVFVMRHILISASSDLNRRFIPCFRFFVTRQFGAILAYFMANQLENSVHARCKWRGHV